MKAKGHIGLLLIMFCLAYGVVATFGQSASVSTPTTTSVENAVKTLPALVPELNLRIFNTGQSSSSEALAGEEYASGQFVLAQRDEINPQELARHGIPYIDLVVSIHRYASTEDALLDLEKTLRLRPATTPAKEQYKGGILYNYGSGKNAICQVGTYIVEISPYSEDSRPLVMKVLDAVLAQLNSTSHKSQATANSLAKIEDILKSLFSPVVKDVSVMGGGVRTPDITVHLFTTEPAQRDKKSDFFLIIKVYTDAKDASAELRNWNASINADGPRETKQAGFDEALKGDGIFLGRLGSGIIKITATSSDAMTPAEFTSALGPLLEAFVRNNNANPLLLQGLVPPDSKTTAVNYYEAPVVGALYQGEVPGIGQFEWDLRNLHDTGGVGTPHTLGIDTVEAEGEMVTGEDEKPLLRPSGAKLDWDWREEIRDKPNSILPQQFALELENGSAGTQPGKQILVRRTVVFRQYKGIFRDYAADFPVFEDNLPFHQAVTERLAAEASDFAAAGDDKTAAGIPGFGDQTAKITVRTDNLVSVHLQKIAVGATVSTEEVSHNFVNDAGQARELSLAELFIPNHGWEKRLSDFCIADLIRQYGPSYNPNLPEDQEPADELAPFGVLNGTVKMFTPKQLSNFNVTPVGLAIRLSSLEVGGGKGADCSVTIPWSSLRDYLRPEGPAKLLTDLEVNASAQTKLHPPQNFSQERLDDIREDLSETYHDTRIPMPQRVQAFDTLLITFDVGTPETVVEKYLQNQAFVLSSEEAEGGDGLETMGLTAPDGTTRWLHFYEDLEQGIEAHIAY